MEGKTRKEHLEEPKKELSAFSSIFKTLDRLKKYLTILHNKSFKIDYLHYFLNSNF